MTRKLIIIELNEVPYRVVDTYCALRPSSALASVLAASAQYETVAEDEGKLQPWITWPSFYRGVNNAQHQLAHLGQCTGKADTEFPPLWKLLTHRGVRCGLFGSLHSFPVPEDCEPYAFYVPDTFAKSSECHPRELDLAQDFNLMMTRESGRNVSRKIPWSSALGLLLRAPRLGLRAATLRDIAGQLIDEARRPFRRVRRRSYQAVLLSDVFMHEVERTRPSFATFFTNNVASAQHRFWAGLYPEDYAKLDLGEGWAERFADEIPFAMDKFDGLLQRLLAFVESNDEYRLVIASSMGQGAIETAAVRSKLYLKDAERFAGALGLRPGDWEQRPAMEPTVNFALAPEKVEFFRGQLERLEIGGEPAYFRERSDGFFNMVFGQSDLPDDEAIVKLGGRSLVPRDLGLISAEVEDGSEGTAYHVPEGIFIVYDPRVRLSDGSRGERTRISSLEVAPAVLRSFGIEPPAYMRPGTSIRELVSA